MHAQLLGFDSVSRRRGFSRTWLLGLLLFITAVAVPCEATRAPGDTRPNLVLFFPDTIAAEAMGSYYKNPIVRVPNFEKLARAGTVFTTAYSSYPQCSPSRAALITGAGYTTVHVGKNDMLSNASFPLSFDYWMDGQGINQGGDSFPFGTEGYYSFMSQPGSQFGNDSSANADLAAVNHALQFMSHKDVPEPFAVFIPGIGAHPPYGMPLDYAGMYSPTEIQAIRPLRPMNDTTGKPPYYGQGGIRGFRNYTGFGDDFSYQIAANYFARISYTDYVFGVLMEGLDSLPLAANTVVAFSSDHGDFFGNYGLVEKWSGAGEELLLHVPLALRVPGGTPGVIIDTPVQIFDLLPTFLDFANASNYLCSLSNVTGYVQFGHSLKPWLFGSQPLVNETHKYLFAEGGYLYQNEIEYNDPTQTADFENPHFIYWPRGQEEHLAPSHAVRFIAMRNASYKIVYRTHGSGVQELYDLTADPRTMTNVWGEPQYASVQAQMLADLLDWMVATADVTPMVYDSRDVPAPSTWPWWPTSVAQSRGNKMLRGTRSPSR